MVELHFGWPGSLRDKLGILRIERDEEAAEAGKDRDKRE